jgi:hypothetical protein
MDFNLTEEEFEALSKEEKVNLMEGMLSKTINLIWDVNCDLNSFINGFQFAAGLLKDEGFLKYESGPFIDQKVKFLKSIRDLYVAEKGVGIDLKWK